MGIVFKKYIALGLIILDWDRLGIIRINFLEKNPF